MWDFQIFLLIILWGPCVWVIECGWIGIKLLCDYGKLSWILPCGAHQVLVGSVLHIWIMSNIQWLWLFIDPMFIITWGKFWKDYRSHCRTKPVLMLLIILSLSQNFLRSVRTMEFLTILWNTGTKNFIGLISLALDGLMTTFAQTLWLVR